MRNQEDHPYIIVERNGGGGFGSFVLGALVGAGLALLFAPQSGDETQEEIRARAQRLRAAAEERLREAQVTLEDRLEDVRDGVESRVELVRDAVQTGRVAAEEARADLESKLERSKAAAKAGIAAAREVAVDGKTVPEEDVAE
jgi:gas vesicle protein